MPIKTPEPARVILATLPTPLMKLERLSAEIGGAAIWMKRDDLTGLELSGNKVRKLEYVLAEALAEGCDTIVTEGTPQSNHCRATAAACAKLGLHALLLFRPEAGPVAQGNHLLDVLLGAETRSYPRPESDDAWSELVVRTIAELRTAGRKPRYTPAGASEPLGCWGYIRAAAELAEQLKTAGIGHCDVIVPLSSGGTYAGLLLGKLLHQLESWALWAVPVSRNVPYYERAIRELCEATIERYSLPITLRDSDFQFIDGYVGDGYAIPYPAEIEAIRTLARVEGAVLDPVYTGKTFCAVLDGLRSGRFGRSRPAVYIHTGGIFSDFAWPELLSAVPA